MPAVFKRFVVACVVLCFAACSSVPLSTMVKLAMNPEARLLESDPAEIAVALDLDARASLLAGAVPTLEFSMKPKYEGAYPPIEEKFKMVRSELGASRFGLEPVSAGRRWTVFVLSPAAVERMMAHQATFKALRNSAKNDQRRGGTVGVGVGLQGVGASSPEQDNMRMVAWLRTSAKEGALKLWSGTPAELHQAAQQGKR